VRLTWDGRTDAGRRAPDGLYRLRVSLRRTGRTAIIRTKSIELDTTAPRPVVVRTRADGGQAAPRGPAIVSPGQSVVVTVRRVSPYRRTRFAIWRTDGRPREVATFESRRKGSRRGIWDGLVDGEPAPPGTYLIVPTVEDRAGNRGSSPAQLPPQPGEVPGRPGVVVRRLAVQPPLNPVRAGSRVAFLVDSRGRGYRWRIRRIGEGAPRRKGSAEPGRPLVVRAPAGSPGSTCSRSATAATRSASRSSSSRPERAKILVVLPAITWLGSGSLDDDGDGIPQLPGARDARAPGPGRSTGSPARFAEESAPLLAFLDRTRVRYDVTTDLADGGDRRPEPDGPRGRPAGRERALDPPAAGRPAAPLRERGGRVAAFGDRVAAPRRHRRPNRLERPTQPTATDAFGARLRPVRRLERPDAAHHARDDPALGLLEGVSDVVGGFRAARGVRPGQARQAAPGGRDRAGPRRPGADRPGHGRAAGPAAPR
jgi:hypothetical protein